MEAIQEDITIGLLIHSQMKKGFSLIELMVAVTIIMLATGGGVVYFNTFNGRQKVRAAKAEVINVLETSRNLARTARYPVDSDNSPIPLRCVSVLFNQNKVTVGGVTVAGAEVTYSPTKVLVDKTVTVASVGATPCFAIYEGKLVDYTRANVSLGTSVPVTIMVGGVQETDTVIITASGTIDD